MFEMVKAPDDVKEHKKHGDDEQGTDTPWTLTLRKLITSNRKISTKQKN